MGRGEESGTATAELVVATPLLLLLILLIVQFALWHHAGHVAHAAAQEGARAARLEGGSATDGRLTAEAFLADAGARVVIDPVVAVHRSAVSARVEVSGYAPIVVPGLRLLLRAVSAGPLERLGAPGEPP